MLLAKQQLGMNKAALPSRRASVLARAEGGAPPPPPPPPSGAPKAAPPAAAPKAKEPTAVASVQRPANAPTYIGADSAALKYLDGSLPGDFGFDPLGLLDPSVSSGAGAGGFVNPRWLQYSEVIHARWAMLGAAGCIAPEILGKAGVIPAETGIDWFRTGVIPPAGVYKNFWADPFTLFFIEVVAIQFAELKRLQDYRNPGSQAKQYFLGLEKFFEGSSNPAYPGGPWFNFAGFGKSEAEMKKLKLNEIKNGRLAMLAMFGYGAQAVITHKGPFQNLMDHLADPTANNILTSFGKLGTGQ